MSSQENEKAELTLEKEVELALNDLTTIEIKNKKHLEFVIEFLKTKKAAESYMKVYGISNKNSAYTSSCRILNQPDVKAFIAAYKAIIVREAREIFNVGDLIKEAYRLAMDPSNDNIPTKWRALEYCLTIAGFSSGNLNSMLDAIENGETEKIKRMIEESRKSEESTQKTE